MAAKRFRKLLRIRRNCIKISLMPDKMEFDSPTPPPKGGADISKEWLAARLLEIEQHTDKDVLTIAGGIDESIAIRVRLALEHIVEERRETLMVIIETPGGSLESAKVIAQTLRNFYDDVHFLVPVQAMSAGTVLVMSGDAIYMDYFSRLGPIDPQIRRGNSYVPALSYLRQYEAMRQKAKTGEFTNADMVLLNKLDLAELDSIELAKSMSESLITDWLPRYKFKDWKAKDAEKQARAKKIAEKLNDQEEWFVHGNGIHMDVLRKDLQLKIDDYGEDGALKSLIWKYFWAMMDYSAGNSFVHSRVFV